MLDRYIKFIESDIFLPPSNEDYVLVEVINQLEVKEEFKCSDKEYHGCFVLLKSRCYIQSSTIDYQDKPFKEDRNLSNTQHTIQYCGFEVCEDHILTNNHLKWVLKLTNHVQLSKELKKTFTPRSLIWDRRDIARWILLKK